MKKLNFSHIVQFCDINFAQYIYPKVEYCNRMMDEQSVAEYSLKFVDERCAKWGKYGTGPIFASDIANSFTAGLSPEYRSIAGTESENIIFWLSYILGCSCSSKPVSEIYPLIRHIAHSDSCTGFRYGYNPSVRQIRSLMAQTDCSPGYLLKNSRAKRIVDDTDDYVSRYSAISEEDLMKEVRRISVYVGLNPLPDECMFLSYYLLHKRLYREWTNICLAMRVPFLQYEFCTGISNPEVFVKLYGTLLSADKFSKALRDILTDRWLSSIVKEKERSAGLTGKTKYEQRIAAIYTHKCKTAEARISKHIESGISEFIARSGDCNSVASWAFSKSKKYDSAGNANESYNDIVDKLHKCVAESVDAEALNTDVNDINYLARMAELYVHNEYIGKEKREILQNSILSFIETGDLYWPGLDGAALSNMRAFAELFAINAGADSTTIMLDKFAVHYEGINATPINEWSKKAGRETFLLCTLLLMSESEDLSEDKQAEIFNLLSSRLLIQCHCCGMDHIVEHIYKPALILAEIVSGELSDKCRERFETDMSLAVYDKQIVTEVLTFAESTITPAALAIVHRYKATEWETVKQYYHQKKMAGKIKFMEKLFAQLK